jgi:tetratricopeptide (TPR) repeat protein
MKRARLLTVCGAATLIVLCLASLTVSQQSASEEDKKKAWEGYALYQVGLQALKGERYSEAVDKLTTAMRDGYRRAEVYNSRGLAYDALGDYERAITDYGQAIRLDPALAEAYGNRGLARIRLGLAAGGVFSERIGNDEVQKDFDRCFQLHPGLKPQFDRLAGEIRSRAPQQSPQTPSGCPRGGEWRRLEPDADLRQWPIVHDIGDANRLTGLQRVRQARLCEKAGEYEHAANYYYEAHELLIEAIPREQLDELLARSTALRAKAQQAPRDRAAGLAAGFSFGALRIQLSDAEGSPAVSRVRDGQKFRIVISVGFSRPGHMEFRGTIRSREEGEFGHVSFSYDNTVFLPKGSGSKYEAGIASDNYRINLPKDVSMSEHTFEIIGSVTVNGVTQTRQTSLTVYR